MTSGFFGIPVGGGTARGIGVWWPIKTFEPCGYGECFEVAQIEEERTAEQLAERIKPRLRCLGHVPPGDRIEAYEEREPVMDTPSETKCAKCKGEGKVITRMEALHAPPAPMMMLKVYSECPACKGTGAEPKEG